MIDPSSSEEEGDDDPVVVAPKVRAVAAASSTSTSKSNVNAATNADTNFSNSKHNGDHFQTSVLKSFGVAVSASDNAFEGGTGAASENNKLEHGTHTMTGGDASGNLEVPNSAISR